MESFLQQIDKFYKSQLRSDALIYMGDTPKVLQDLGAEDLPLVMKQSNLRKCIRENRGSRSAHNMPRIIVEQIPNQLNSPIVVAKDKSRNAVAVILDCKDYDGNNILAAVHMGNSIYNKRFNEVKSFYGRCNLEPFLQKHLDAKELYVIDKEKAKKLSLTIGHQLSKAPITSGYDNTILVKKEYVKTNHKISKSEIARDLRKHGFQPTKSLIKNMEKLKGISGQNYTLADIYTIHKGKAAAQPQERELVEKIAKECREQELAKKTKPCSGKVGERVFDIHCIV